MSDVPADRLCPAAIPSAFWQVLSTHDNLLSQTLYYWGVPAQFAWTVPV